MSKPKTKRALKDNEAKAVLRMLRTSGQKLNLVAQMIRGKKVEKALAELQFSHKRIAGPVRKTLESAIANAENNHNLEPDQLVVAEAYVGDSLVMKRAVQTAIRMGAGGIRVNVSGRLGGADIARTEW